MANTGSQSITAPADKPCVIGFVNFQKQDLTVQFSNQNVSAYLFTLRYPNDTQLTPLQFTKKIEISKDIDMAYLYLGSLNN